MYTAVQFNFIVKPYLLPYIYKVFLYTLIIILSIKVFFSFIQYQPISLQYFWLSNKQPIRVWPSVGYNNHWYLITNKQVDNSIIIIPCYITATGRALGSKGWTLLLRTLTLQLNSNLNDDDRAFALALCASDIFQDLLKRYPPLYNHIIIYYEVSMLNFRAHKQYYSALIFCHFCFWQAVNQMK